MFNVQILQVDSNYSRARMLMLSWMRRQLVQVGLKQQQYRLASSAVSADLVRYESGLFPKEMTARQNILMIDCAVGEECINEFTQRGHTVDMIQKPSDSTLNEIIQNYQAILLNPATTLNAEILAQAPDLKLIGVPSATSGTLDLMAATKQGVLVLNCSEKTGQSASAEAELVMSLLFALARHIPQAVDKVKSATPGLQRREFAGVELHDRVLGIVGFSSVGRMVANFAVAMGMRVLAYDPTVADELMTELGVTNSSLDSLYQQSDFITFHVPLTQRTRGLFSEKAMQMSKEGLQVISASSAGIVDESAIKEALSSDRKSGAAFDTFHSDPLSTEF